MYIFGQSHIENVYSWQKTTDTIVFLGESAVRLCKKIRSKWSGNWCKITSNLLFFAQSRTALPSLPEEEVCFLLFILITNG
jgi:hypothetical protein